MVVATSAFFADVGFFPRATNPRWVATDSAFLSVGFFPRDEPTARLLRFTPSCRRGSRSPGWQGLRPKNRLLPLGEPPLDFQVRLAFLVSRVAAKYSRIASRIFSSASSSVWPCDHLDFQVRPLRNILECSPRKSKTGPGLGGGGAGGEGGAEGPGFSPAVSTRAQD